MSSDQSDAAAATIDAWRARGDDRFDRVRFRLIEALGRRAQAHDGAARRVLDDKVAGLIATYGADLESARRADGNGESRAARPQDPPHRGALAALLDHIESNGPNEANGTAAGGAGRDLASPLPELKTVRVFKRTWTRLTADRWLSQSLAKLPKNAGPLNSHHLMHRSLALMREVSPDYLNRFMAYVDALSWVDQAVGEGASAGATNASRATRGRKSSRGKSG